MVETEGRASTMCRRDRLCGRGARLGGWAIPPSLPRAKPV